MSKSPSSEVMNITNMLDQKNAAAAAAAVAAVAAAPGPSPEQQLLAHAQHPSSAMDRSNSPHGSENSYRSVSRVSQPLEALAGMGNGRSYGSPSAIQGAMSLPDPNMAPGMMIPSMPPVSHGVPLGRVNPQSLPEPSHPTPKPFPCRTCSKAFARRSDLSRHERIHSGIRPHVCDFKDCARTFIQRSALTVHLRVHTGEKPHVCERCGKPFSDSSSLARHRRIHSGRRPYICPFANCQKTFTRRTTLTRHQNAHTGTVEEAAAATATVLANHASGNASAVARAARSDGDPVSNHGSPLITPSPGHRQMSMSPSAELAAANTMRNNDYSYVNNGSLPAHLRTDMQSQSPTSAPSYTTSMRPTSHPAPYPPPPTLEPSVESHQSATASTAGSPHMGSVGWQSPSHMPSPTHSNSGNSYVYPDPDQSFLGTGNLGQMYYNGAAQIRRPASPESGSTGYEIKSRPSEVWASQ
ncbi:hypothetical protein GGR54DRAFT_361535 [Hypoxylon sp. NC1633]|nr:hypothetical protein GGR54DRAFT_361535 [Hypoxylon sp. NC1633]